jgi:antitoxin VapB
MTTTTLPADPETERLARQMAEAAGKPVETILREALAAHAWGLGIIPPAPPRRRTPDQIRAALEEAAARLSAMPVLDPRTADEIIGYDEYGIPR